MGKRAERQQTKVDAPSVWRDHESRTCIVLEADSELIKYIPLTVDTPFDVQECSDQAFRTQVYLEPIDYPVERAARLFIEYSRNTGATEDVLKALAPFTNISNEEKTMARAKATARNADQEIRRGRPSKKTATKKTAAKKKAVGEKKPRVSAAGVYREQILAGKSAKQIVAAVERKFPGKGRLDYVKWYWKDVCKENQVPEPKGMAAAIKAEKGK